MRLHARIVTLEYLEPFVISRSADTSSQVVQVAISHDGLVGYGEGGRTTATTRGPRRPTPGSSSTLSRCSATTRSRPSAILGRLAELPGQMAAKCAVDGALHDLLGKICGQPLWRILGLDRTPPPTSYTISIDTLEGTADRARRAASTGHSRSRSAAPATLNGCGSCARLRPTR